MNFAIVMFVLAAAGLAFAVIASLRGARGAHLRIVYRHGTSLTIVNVAEPDEMVFSRVLDLLEDTRKVGVRVSDLRL
jgi:hypothetical protein